MRTLFFSLLLLPCLALASRASANCDPGRFSDPNNPHFRNGNFVPIEGVQNGYVDLNGGQINSDGNVQFGTTDVVDEKDGVCTIHLEWEVDCDKQQFRLLWSRAFYDQDWPTQRDATIQGDKIWSNYRTADGIKRIGNVADIFCSRRNQLPRTSP